jgi:hypothetical protein
MALTDGYFGLQANVNKVAPEQPEQKEGVVGDLLPELHVDTPDEDLLQMAKKAKHRWEDAQGALKKRQDENENYWKGKQFPGAEVAGLERPLVDNLIFTALETFLPIATRQNPEAIVEAANDASGQALADKVAKMLAFHADRLVLKSKVKKATRFWALYLFGVMKHGWSEAENDITSVVLRPQKMILDPDATVSDDGTYEGDIIGEYRTDKATALIKRFSQPSPDGGPSDVETFITERVQGKMGTEVRYIEWWTDDMVFWQLDDKILMKAKNPHWNYEQSQPQIDPVTGAPAIGPDGQPAVITTPGYNHFSLPRKPYTFLTVFNLGTHPWDDTSLIEQNLALQDKINKRIRQIDKNIDSMNGGFVASGTSFTQEDADLAVDALRRGGAVIVPNGDTNAIKRDAAPPLPGDVFTSLMDYRREVGNIFGTSASTPQGIASEDTVRGKILTRTQDETRIGGGITEFIEQFTDNVFNWWVQLMCVYYTEEHAAAILGKARAQEYVTLQAQEFNQKLLVSVKEGSLIPKDPLTTANQAVDLASAGLLDPISMFERLDFPDPIGTADKPDGVVP